LGKLETGIRSLVHGITLAQGIVSIAILTFSGVILEVIAPNNKTD
jgi:hypothetical protein